MSRSAELNKKADASVGGAGTNQINDNQLARLFIEANLQAQNTDKAESQNLLDNKEETYIHVSHAPDDQLCEELRKSIGDTKEFHHDLIDVHLEPGALNYIKHKFRQFAYQDIRSTEGKDVNIVPVDWLCYQTYRAHSKKRFKTYRQDFATHTELYLKQKDKLKDTLTFEFWVLILGLAFAFVLYLYNGAIYVGKANTHVNRFMSNFKFSVLLLNSFSVFFLLFPYALLTIMWFININHLHKSKNYHYFLTASNGFGYLLILLGFFLLGVFLTLDQIYKFRS